MPTYLSPPIETDPDLLAQECFDFLQTEYPGWIPSEGNFEVWLTEAMARMIAQLRDITSLVPTAIFKYFGQTLLGVLPIEATQATGATTWTLVDTQGYTIPAGTQCQIADAAGSMYAFETAYDVIVPPGQSVTPTGEVIITAVFPGADSSGLTGDIDLLDVLPFVASAIVEGETSGGQDAQTDDQYLDRLVEQLQLMAPRPILPADFAGIAKNIAGVFRAFAYDGYVPGVNEVQQIAVDATGGTFTVSFGGQTTPPQSYNVTAAALQTALQALGPIGVNNVLVTGGPGNAGATTPYVLTFVGGQGNLNIAQVTTDSTLLTGGTSHVATPTTLTSGAAARFNVERYVTVFPVDQYGQPISQTLKTELAAFMDATREVNFVVPIADPVYNMIDVDVQFTRLPGTDHDQVQAAVVSALQLYLDPSRWGIPGTDIGGWINSTVLRYLEISQVVNNVLGVDYIVDLTIAPHGATPVRIDIQMNGDVALPTSGSIVSDPVN